MGFPLVHGSGSYQGRYLATMVNRWKAGNEIELLEQRMAGKEIIGKDYLGWARILHLRTPLLLTSDLATEQFAHFGFG